jgi:hypothetical protein
MKEIIPNFDSYLNEMKQTSGSFAKVFIDSGVVVKFTKDITEMYAWKNLLRGDVYKKFPQTPKIFNLYEFDGTGDNRYVIVMEQIKEISDSIADKIEEDLIQIFGTTYIENILDTESEGIPIWETMFDKKTYTYKILRYCSDFRDFCKSIGLYMKVLEIQNIGINKGNFAFYDMGECETTNPNKNFETLQTNQNDMLGIAKELIKNTKK